MAVATALLALPPLARNGLRAPCLADVHVLDGQNEAVRENVNVVVTGSTASLLKL